MSSQSSQSSPFNLLCNLLNESYENISPDLVQSTFSAIRAADSAHEFDDRELYWVLRHLILSMANPHQDDSHAVNVYMTNNATRGSSTRPFFYHMTLPGNFNPEDNPSIPPPPRSSLQLSPSLPSSFAFVPHVPVPQESDQDRAYRERAELFISSPIGQSIILPSFNQISRSPAMPPLRPLPLIRSLPPLIRSLPPLIRPLPMIQPLPPMLQPLRPLPPMINTYYNPNQEILPSQVPFQFGAHTPRVIPDEENIDYFYEQ